MAKEGKMAADKSAAIASVRKTVYRKTSPVGQNYARNMLSRFLDKVASYTSIQKQAQIRVLQTAWRSESLSQLRLRKLFRTFTASKEAFWLSNS